MTQHSATLDSEDRAIRSSGTRAITGKSLSILPSFYWFLAKHVWTGDCQNGSGPPFLDNPSFSAPFSLLLHKKIPIAEFSEDCCKRKLRILLFAGHAVYERIELRKPLDITLHQKTIADHRIHGR